MPDYKTLLFDVQDNVATITFNRPEAANAMNGDMARELLDVATFCDEDDAVRAILLTGKGRMFCAGGDLKGFAAQGDDAPRFTKLMATFLHAAISRFNRGAAPVIAAVNGTAAGAGMSLVSACDLALAAESAVLTMAYTRAGLTPDGSSTYFLPRKVGLQRALELVLTNRVLSAQEAMEWGLLTRVVPDDELMKEARALASQIAAGPTLAFGNAKRLLYGGFAETLESQLELETRAIADMMRTDDAREGINAFIEKRQPNFVGH